jgi:hydantoinase/carbamoylase family amidase
MRTVGEASEHAGDQVAVAARISAQLDALAKIGADPSGGVTRLAYSPSERAAHALFAEWVARDGKTVQVDAAGNSVAVYREGTPYFLLGSHLDTVVQGGSYDGAAGVVGALEAARVLSDLDFGLRVVAFAGEEGARFGRPTLGSSIAAGLLTADAFSRLRDAKDKPLAEAAAELGLDPLACEPWIDERIACFFEIHIEQGRQLEAGAARIGLVDTIAGSVRIRFDFVGRADHSGATPMSMRLDALAAASELVLAVEEAAQSYRSTVATVGKVDVSPNSVTTVPGNVRLWVDIRDVDSVVQRSTANAVFERALEIAEARGISIHGDVVSELTPVVLEAWPRELAHEECASLGVPYRVMPSGAGHDAAIVARQAPATMIFIPCVDGVSHSPREMASPDDIAVAATVVAATVRRASRLLR